MKLGAVDVLRKPFEPGELLDAVRRAIHDSIAVHEKHDQDSEIRKRFATLSQRELQLLKMIVNGKANKVIAGDLELSQRTVEIHRARVMEKMQATSLAHLVRMVIAVDDAEEGDVGVTKLTRA